MQKWKDFFERDIWNIRIADLSKLKGAILALGRVCVLTTSAFVKNRCQLRASALTFFTLMSIVPVAALVFGVARGWRFDEILQEKLRESMVGNEQVADWIINFAGRALDTAGNSVVTGVGIALLLLTAISLLVSIENSFNDIWGIKQGRNWLRKMSDYLTMLIVFPILTIALVSGSALCMAKLRGVLGVESDHTFLHVFYRFSAPLLLSWLTFFFIYLFIPNTKVKFRAAFAGGVFTGTLFVILQYGYMYLQTILTNYNAIYGSFAALPFFLLWLQMAWTLILLGAQLSFSIQNAVQYEFYPEDVPLSQEYRALCALRIMEYLALRFIRHDGPRAAETISAKLKIPIRVARHMLYDLAEAGLITESRGDKRIDDSYQIALPPSDLTPVSVLRALSRLGMSGYRNAEQMRRAERLLENLWEGAENAEANRPLGYQIQRPSLAEARQNPALQEQPTAQTASAQS